MKAGVGERITALNGVPCPRSGSRFRAAGIGALLAAVLAGCATVPPALPPADAVSWIGGQPRVLARLDATQVSAWHDVTSTPELKAVGERTHIVWIGLDLDSLDDLKTAAKNLHIVLEGDFPKGAAGLMLDWNKAWTKASPGVWTNAKYGLSVTLPRDNVITVRRDDAPVAAAPGALRDLDPAALNGSAAWISLWNPGGLLFGPVGAKLLPVSRLDVALHEQGLYLEGTVVLYFADERAAKAALVVLKLVASAVRARLGQDLTWTVEETQIVGQTLKVKQDDLKTLALTLINPEKP